MRTEFQRLLAERDYYNKKFLHRAYLLAEGNLSVMAKGLKISRVTLYKFMREAFGYDWKLAVKRYEETGERYMPYIGYKGLT